jgi:catechol 2,3-dioxygenase-like lactoylglutathione lyase family enzyme
MIRGIRDVQINVSRMQRSISFFRDVLMLRQTEEGTHFSAFDVGGMRLGLHWTGGKAVPRVPRDAHGPEAGAIITFRVSDIFTAVDHYREQGVRFIGEIDSHPWGTGVCFEDPDGNVFKLMQTG